MQINLNSLSLSQLHAIDNSLEALMLKQTGTEDFEPSFYADPKQFQKLISLMVSTKSNLMGYFKKQYENRYNLVNRNVVKFDEYDDYLYAEQWDRDQQALSLFLESDIAQSYDLGIQALAFSLGILFNYSYQDAQKAITKSAQQAADDITTTTKRRVKLQIQAAMKANEDRTAFDVRMQNVFINPYRGRFIAQNEAINSYIKGKEGLAVSLDLGYKTALSAQARDKICGMVNGETVEIDKPFSNGLMRPTFHYGCKCDVKYSDQKPKQ